MIIRTVAIDEAACNGCGLCVKACHEGALKLIDGKAKLVNESLCDGMGDCLPACPQNAIKFVKKDVVPNLMAAPTFQWPIKLALISPAMPGLKGTLVIASDCTGFVKDNIKKELIGKKPMMICCPKLEDRSRFEKLKEIFTNAPIDNVEILRIDIPCCSMLTRIVKDAVTASGKDIGIREIIVGRDGRLL